MSESEIRCSIEWREDETRQTPGRLVGTLLTYGERAKDRPEIFESGALEWPAGGIVLNRQHQRGAPIMRVVPEIKGQSVVIDALLPDTAAGRDTATEVRAGLFSGMSIEFKAIRQRIEGGVRKISKAMLRAAAIVDSPSYAGSAVEVRKQKRRRRVWL